MLVINMSSAVAEQSYFHTTVPRWLGTVGAYINVD